MVTNGKNENSLLTTHTSLQEPFIRCAWWNERKPQTETQVCELKAHVHLCAYFFTQYCVLSTSMRSFRYSQYNFSNSQLDHVQQPLGFKQFLWYFCSFTWTTMTLKSFEPWIQLSGSARYCLEKWDKFKPNLVLF